MKRIVSLSFVIASSTLLLSCKQHLPGMGNSEADASGEVSNGDQLKAKLAELQAKSSDRSTPDKAIESFVAARNEMARYKCYIIEEQRRSGRSQDAAEKLDAYYLTFFAERAYAAKKPDADESLSQCVEKADKISLEIKEVKEETPTRAIALVNIRNITPIPTGASMDDFTKKHRAEGENYEYQLTRDKTGWKIAQVYALEGYPEEWKPKYNDDDAPYVPWIVWPD